MTVLAEEAPANYVPAAAVIMVGGERYPESLGVKRAQAGFQAARRNRAQPRKRPELESLGCGRGSGIPGVAVKCADIGKNTDGEGVLGRHRRWRAKAGERTGLDTLVVPAVNDGR